MTDRSTWYAHQCIAASGLAVMDPRIAFQLRTDLWSGLQDCAITFRRQQRLEGTKHLVATFPTWGRVEVYARPSTTWSSVWNGLWENSPRRLLNGNRSGRR